MIPYWSISADSLLINFYPTVGAGNYLLYNKIGYMGWYQFAEFFNLWNFMRDEVANDSVEDRGYRGFNL